MDSSDLGFEVGFWAFSCAEAVSEAGIQRRFSEDYHSGSYDPCGNLQADGSTFSLLLSIYLVFTKGKMHGREGVGWKWNGTG